MPANTAIPDILHETPGAGGNTRSRSAHANSLLLFALSEPVLERHTTTRIAPTYFRSA